MVNRKLKWTSVSSAEVEKQKFRLEASVYKIEARAARELVLQNKFGFTHLWGEDGLVQHAFYPGRFKRIYVSKGHGYPMILPSQMTNINPKATKFISRKALYNVLKLKPQTLLITRSGTVGNCAIVSRTLQDTTMSDDVIRVTFKDECDLGYVYTFLRTATGKVLISTTNYGSVIKHIEPEHLQDVIIPQAPLELKQEINYKIQLFIDCLDKSNDLVSQAEKILIENLNLPPLDQIPVSGLNKTSGAKAFATSFDQLNYRLDASYHNPLYDGIMDILLDNAKSIFPLADNRMTKTIIMAGRFKRHYVDPDYGTVFLGGKQIHELDPSNKKYLSIKKHGGRIENQLFLHENMIAVTCSGTIGRVNIIPRHWENWTMSQHVLRAVPINNELAGYLYIWLNSEYGQALISKHTYGSVVDEINDWQLGQVPIPILKDGAAIDEINSLALQANKLRSDAYYFEQEALNTFNSKILLAE